MGLYREKKPVIVEAVQYIGDNLREISDFTKGRVSTNTCFSYLSLLTNEGLNLKVNLNDYVIKGFDVGEYFILGAAKFEKQYVPFNKKHCGRGA